MTMTDKIMTIIMNDPVTEEIFQETGGCFRNIVCNTLMECNNDNVLETSISMLAIQCKLYDIVLNNIAQFGNEELIKKCRNGINAIFPEE